MFSVPWRSLPGKDTDPNSLKRHEKLAEGYIHKTCVLFFLFIGRVSLKMF